MQALAGQCCIHIRRSPLFKKNRISQQPINIVMNLVVCSSGSYTCTCVMDLLVILCRVISDGFFDYMTLWVIMYVYRVQY